MPRNRSRKCEILEKRRAEPNSIEFCEEMSSLPSTLKEKMLPSSVNFNILFRGMRGSQLSPSLFIGCGDKVRE